MKPSFNNFLAQRAQHMKCSDIREFFKLTEQKEVTSFAGGFPSASFFPVEQINSIFNACIATEAQKLLQYGPTEGLAGLRALVLDSMYHCGVTAAEENLLITGGSQQGLDLACKLLINPGDTVIVEEPGYVGALGAVNNYEGNMVSIPLDSQGIRIDILEQYLQECYRRAKRVKFLYLVPNFQNPTGVTLSLSRRTRLLALAARYDFLIVEDDPYGELRYEGEALPLVKSMDEEERVIYMGSFSKIFVPGIRVGWVVASAELVARMIMAKQATDLCGNTLGQQLVYHFCREGHLNGHIQRLRGEYKHKRDLMLEAMERYFPPGVTWTRPEGGFFIWVCFPPQVIARSLLLKALEHKVAFVDGKGFFRGGKGYNTARFSFSEPPEEKIIAGIERVGKLVEAEMEISGQTASL